MNSIWKYIVKRIAQIIGVVFLLSVATFLFSVNATIDPVDIAFAQMDGALVDAKERIILEKQKEQRREALGMYLPSFYVSVTPLAWKEQVRDLKNKKLIQWVTEQTYKGYHCSALISYATELQELSSTAEFLQNEACQTMVITRSLKDDFESHQVFIEQLLLLKWSQTLHVRLEKCLSELQEASELGNRWSLLVPTLRFHGTNRYHQWLFGSPATGAGFIRGDFGTSLVTQKKVSRHIKEVLPWTLVLSFLSIIISLVGSVLIGTVTAYFQGSLFDKLTHSFLFLLFTIPTFWLATLLLMFFTNPDYLNWFPSGGVAPLYDFKEMPSVWERIAASSWHLVLPLVCFSYGGLTYLSRLTRSSAIDALNKTYVFSARARGIKEFTVVFRHVLKNALLPLITVVGSILPSLFAGSLIIERIFSIPGLGNEVFNASSRNDLNLLMAIFTISGLLSAIGYLISDILYQVVDPRIQLKDM